MCTVKGSLQHPGTGLQLGGTHAAVLCLPSPRLYPVTCLF
jgi:hypothetical protein